MSEMGCCPSASSEGWAGSAAEATPHRAIKAELVLPWLQTNLTECQKVLPKDLLYLSFDELV